MSKNNISTIEKWADFITTKNIDGLIGLYSENGIYEDVAIARVNTGEDEIRLFFTQGYERFDEWTITPKSIVVDEKQGAMRWTMSGKLIGELPGITPCGQAFSSHGVTYFDFQDGEIIHSQDFHDVQTLLTQWKEV